MPPGLIHFRAPLCPKLSRSLREAAEANFARYADLAGGPGATPHVKTGGIYVHTPGPWFETPIEDRTYRRLGYDSVGKTAGPEFRLARMYRMCLGILSIVVNHAEGLGDFEHEDLRTIYRRCGPLMARMVIEAMAAAPDQLSTGARESGGDRAGSPAEASSDSRADVCHCAGFSRSSLLQEFSPFAVYGGDRTHARSPDSDSALGSPRQAGGRGAPPPRRRRSR